MSEEAKGQVLKFGTLRVKIYYLSYSKEDKDETETEGSEIGQHFRSVINKLLDKADSGEFYKQEDDVKIITGYYEVTNENLN